MSYDNRLGPSDLGKNAKCLGKPLPRHARRAGPDGNPGGIAQSCRPVDPRTVDLQQHGLLRRQQRLQDFIQALGLEPDDLPQAMEGDPHCPCLRYQGRHVVGGRGVIGSMFEPLPIGPHEVCMTAGNELDR